MKLFQNERVVRLLRPLVTALGLIAALWHGMHTLSAWTQWQELKATDPARSESFQGVFQSELSLALAAFVAGILAWQLFKPRPHPPA